MKEKTIKEAYHTIKKKIGFEKFCKTLNVGDSPCPLWLEGIKYKRDYCEYCSLNRQKILGELDKKFRKEKLEKLLNG